MAGGAGSFQDQVQRVRNQIRNALEEDSDSEWFDGTMSETGANSSHAGPPQQCILGQDVMPHVGDHVVVLDVHLARWLAEPTGTIMEVRCDGGHVKVEHDGAAREERYYNTGKDGVYQLALAPPLMPVADPRPRFSLPRPPSKVEVATPASNPTLQRPRYSEVRRSTSQTPRQADPVAEPESLLVATRSASVTSVSSSRPRYSELRKARRSAMGQPPPGEATEASCASSTISTGGSPTRQAGAYQAPEPASLTGNLDEMPGLEPRTSTPRARSRYSELRKASRSPVRVNAPSSANSVKADQETSTPPAPPGQESGKHSQGESKTEELLKRLELMERETILLTKQLNDLKSSKQSDIQMIRDECRKEVESCERRCLSSFQDQSRRQLEACEERLFQQFREETRKLMEASERRILAEVIERSEKRPDKIMQREQPEMNEEPEQEYETPNGEEEAPYYLESKIRQNDGLSRAELTDSELSLQTIGSIARRVSASLGGRPGSAASSHREPDRRQAVQRHVKEPKERQFDFEQEMEHLADMRRFASQVLGTRSQEAASSRMMRDPSNGEWRTKEQEVDRARRSSTPPPASPMFGHPHPNVMPQSQAVRTAKAVPCAERWRRRPSAVRVEAEPPVPWDDEEEDTPYSREMRDDRTTRSVWQQVDSEGRLIF